MTPGARRRALAYVGGIMLLAPALLWVVGRTFFVGVPAAWHSALWIVAGGWLLAGLIVLLASWRRGRDVAE
ncbi:hypothetical protein [Deinococcus aerophilus]|uniref:DUF3311 domain-containing protein n=1 Tax=Deinococcus aerophilus TaxID=522488 RepID=A0ABQ2GIK6_9DEIO|nr:hypothetical protein [Deinococcus aerophilus]GGL97382.1 hypothetical protein GCM10010841_02220 [Deinococcus aerophilus]